MTEQMADMGCLFSHTEQTVSLSMVLKGSNDSPNDSPNDGPKDGPKDSLKIARRKGIFSLHYSVCGAILLSVDGIHE